MSIAVAQVEMGLHHIIVGTHDCECVPCQRQQHALRYTITMAWYALDGDEQMAWLEMHADDEHGTLMRALLGEAAASGFDPWQPIGE